VRSRYGDGVGDDINLSVDCCQGLELARIAFDADTDLKTAWIAL
jgi:hypothetical protein